ncbi:hypothetical protein [Microcystis aeruginosa]|uniref:hypothetical protein n=1 Tax=Microcystis aeruginosa TaxID=1126 RepID=UPI001231729F|nr:hypothetical protein [Microcystis aeruginosa]
MQIKLLILPQYKALLNQAINANCASYLKVSLPEASYLKSATPTPANRNRWQLLNYRPKQRSKRE